MATLSQHSERQPHFVAFRLSVEEKVTLERLAEQNDSTMSEILRSLIRQSKNFTEMQITYDALAPDWNDAPGWANWYAINPNGVGQWFDKTPYIASEIGVWNRWATGYHVGAGPKVDLPLGVDWRLCLWERPAA